MSAEELDPDSPMHSSPSDSLNENEDSELFPPITNNMEGPSTPQNNHLNALAPGELSPPRSQSQPRRAGMIDGAADDNRFMAVDRNGGGGGVMAESGEAQQFFRERIADTDGSSDVNANSLKPGAGWKTKRAQEDYQRAMENVVDKDFSLREFGDLFDDRRGGGAGK